MSAGERRNVVAVGRYSGGVFTAWREPFAKVEVIRGVEQMDGGQRLAETVWRVTFDYYDVEGIDEDMQMVVDGVTLDIKAIRQDVQRRHLTVVEGLQTAPAAPGTIGGGGGGDDGPPPGDGGGQHW